MYKFNKIGFCRFLRPRVVKLWGKIWGKFQGAPHFQIRSNFPNLIVLPSNEAVVLKWRKKKSYFLNFHLKLFLCLCSSYSIKHSLKHSMNDRWTTCVVEQSFLSKWNKNLNCFMIFLTNTDLYTKISSLKTKTKKKTNFNKFSKQKKGKKKCHKFPKFERKKNQKSKNSSNLTFF